MKTIKFSHKYHKLLRIDCKDGHEARLLHVFEENFKNIKRSLSQYDCLYPQGSYQLPKSGKCLVLLFQHQDGQLFTTIRTAFPTHKVDYYKGAVNEIFKVSIEK